MLPSAANTSLEIYAVLVYVAFVEYVANIKLRKWNHYPYTHKSGFCSSCVKKATDDKKRSAANNIK